MTVGLEAKNRGMAQGCQDQMDEHSHAREDSFKLFHKSLLRMRMRAAHDGVKALGESYRLSPFVAGLWGELGVLETERTRSTSSVCNTAHSFSIVDGIRTTPPFSKSVHLIE
jgi:hypothetical protein